MPTGEGLSFLLISWDSGLVFRMIKTVIRTYEIKVAANSEGCLHDNLKPVRGSEEIQVSVITNGQSFQDRCLGWGWGCVLLNALNRKRQVLLKVF